MFIYQIYDYILYEQSNMKALLERLSIGGT